MVRPSSSGHYMSHGVWCTFSECKAHDRGHLFKSHFHLLGNIRTWGWAIWLYAQGRDKKMCLPGLDFLSWKGRKWHSHNTSNHLPYTLNIGSNPTQCPSWCSGVPGTPPTVWSNMCRKEVPFSHFRMVDTSIDYLQLFLSFSFFFKPYVILIAFIFVGRFVLHWFNSRNPKLSYSNSVGESVSRVPRGWGCIKPV